MASVNIAGVVSVSPGAAATSMGKALSTVGLDQLKGRLEGALRDARVRVVVMIDDIDRLDRDEIHAVFKLVKLSADFDYTSYVLAFDDVIVSDALGARYGAGNPAAGRSFLEKIVQTPLHLPPASRDELLAVTFRGIEEVLNQCGIEISDDDGAAFVQRYQDGIAIRMQTPRQSKLYINAISFALPILKGEVNTADQLLIEGIRIIYPKLYTIIRSNPQHFLEKRVTDKESSTSISEIESCIDTALTDLTATERQVVRERLLAQLFPQYSVPGFGMESDAGYESGKRICSPEYFARYFAYGIPSGDLSDVEVTGFTAATSAQKESEIDDIMKKMQSNRTLGKLISKLSVRPRGLRVI